jgi:hypothetical protein
LPPTTVCSSFGATRIQQLSHQTLNAALPFSVFAAFISPPGFDWLIRPLLIMRYGRVSVIRLMSAGVQRASQHKSCGRRRLVLPHTFTAVQGKQNGNAAPLTANAQIPSGIVFRPSRNVHQQPLSIKNTASRASRPYCFGLLLLGTGFVRAQCPAELPDTSSHVQLRSVQTIKPRTITILPRQIVLLPF